jgi:hypothetical protein
MAYPALQSMFDALNPPGMQRYWKGDFVASLPDEAIEAHIAHAAKAPSYFSRMHPLSDRRRRAEGQVRHGLERPRRSPFDGRRHRSGPLKAGQLKEWATPYWKAVRPYDLAGAYTNFMMGGDGEERAGVADAERDIRPPA